MNKEDIKKDIGKYKSIEVLANTEGGELLISTFYKDIVHSIEWLGNNYKTATHAELVGHIAQLQGQLAVLKIFKNSKKNAELAEEALRKVLEEQEP